MTKNNRTYGKFLFTITVISIMMIGLVAWRPQVKADGALPPMTLTIVALDGTQQVLHENDIGSLMSYRAFGGFVKSTGALSGLGNYTGVPISTFVNMIGGISNGYSIKIIAIDNFSKTLSYEALNGTGLVTYDNVTGQIVQHNQTLTPMLAYYYNDANLTSGGPLRLAIVGPEGLLTQSSLWVSNVVRIEVHPNLQPMNLTVVGLNGTQLNLNETSISSLPAIRGVGASRNQLGIVKSLGNYTGPSLNTFCNLVGGMSNTTVLRVTAIDGYNQTFSYNQVNGAFATFDNVSGQPVQANQSLTPLLAYHFNDANLSSSDGPLKLVIIGPEGLATTSSYWVKEVVKLEILQLVTPVTVLMTVEPSVYHAKSMNETFSVNIDIYNVTDPMKLIGFEFKLGYNTTLLDVVQVQNGTFLEAYGGSPNGGMLYYGPYYGDDYVLFAGFILPDVNGTWHEPFPTGNGTLATITFRTKYQSIGLANPPDSCNLTLFDTKLADPQANVISHNSTNGYYDIVPSPVGDLNFDGKVDIFDALVFANSFGAKPTDARWNSYADLNHDNVIDIFDAIILGNHFGEKRADP